MFNYKQIYSASLLLLILIGGCSTWEDFTTYFNVYYNAKLNFDEAMEDIGKNEKDIFEFKEKPVSANADKALTKVIEKCSAILQYNAESAYFDDALYIIGVAYYYKQNYSKALRKFRELEIVKETDLALDNKLWIGKTELQLRNFEEGLKQLDEVKEIAGRDENEEILEAAYQTEIAFHFFQENYETAVQTINNFLKDSENDERKAEVAYQLGKIYLELNNFQKASEAFASVLNYSPTTKTEFQSKLELAKTQLLLEDYEKSYEILNELRYEDKYIPYSDVIIYQLGVVNYKRDDLDQAVNDFLTVDSMKVTSEKETPGLARIKLGEIWEYEYMDYDSAAKYYNKAASSLLTPDEKSYAISKTTLFRNYKNFSKEIYKYERQLAYVINPEEFIKDSIDYADYLFELKQDSLNNAVGIGENTTNTGGSIRDRARGIQSLNNPQELEQRIKPVRPTLGSDTLLTIISKGKYDLGNMFFIEFNVPDSAYFYYTDVLNNYPPQTFTPNVMYALGSYYLSVDDTVKADSIFQLIYDEYQGEAVAGQAAKRLGISEFDVETDTSAQLYLTAEEKLLNKNYNGAIKDFYVLAEKFPESILAPKALYSAGWIMENELKNFDSAAVVYDTLNVRYEKSLYAKEIAAKLQEYKKETSRMRIEDSIKNAQTDSVKAGDKNNLLQKEDSKQEAPKPKQVSKKGGQNTQEMADSLKSPEELRKEMFLKTERGELKDTLDIKQKKELLEDRELLEEKPDSSLKVDSLKVKQRLR